MVFLYLFTTMATLVVAVLCLCGGGSVVKYMMTGGLSELSESGVAGKEDRGRAINVL